MTTISQSWQDLAPRGSASRKEPFDSYMIRIRLNEAYNHIPDEIFKQWIHPLHKDGQTLQNYAWLNFQPVSFKLVERDIAWLKRLNLVPMFESMRHGFDDPLAALPPSEAPFWMQYGTWRVPPIALDVDSLPPGKPAKAQLKAPYQLVEGHSRFHNLLISEYQQLNLAPQHQIYLMCINAQS
jgi:hypothetical protein